MSRMLIAVAALLAMGCMTGEASLSVTAEPRTIAGQGQTTKLTVTATDGEGQVGKGKVTLSAPAGVFEDPVLTLDPFGRASTTFSCDLASDPGCVGTVAIKAAWAGSDARVSVTVTGFDAGWMQTMSGPQAFPIGKVFATMLSSGSSGIDSLSILVWSSDKCGNETGPRDFLTFNFYDQAGLTPGTFAVGGQSGRSCNSTYGRLAPGSDGGLQWIEGGRQALSGSCGLASLGGDGGLQAVQATGTFDLMVPLLDGGTSPLRGTWETNCPR